jgi:hypothetical protein
MSGAIRETLILLVAVVVVDFVSVPVTVVEVVAAIIKLDLDINLSFPSAGFTDWLSTSWLHHVSRDNHPSGPRSSILVDVDELTVSRPVLVKAIAC